MQHLKSQVQRAPADALRRTTLAPARPAPATDALTQLQGFVGNAALGDFLSALEGSRQTLSVQRWEGPEHGELGSSTGVQNIDLGGGVVLTWGQVIALAGDHYPTLKELRDDAGTFEGRQRIRAALENAGVADARTMSALPAPTPKQLADEKKNLVLLSMSNAEHFAGEGASMDTWRGYHASALSSALLAGFHAKPEEMNEAQLQEAFGQHYLTDSFSGGHIRVPRQSIIDWYVGTFAPRVVDHLLRSLKSQLVLELYLQIYPQVSAVFDSPTVMGAVDLLVNRKINQAIEKIGGRAKLIDWLGKAVAGAVSGALHDMEGERGVWVASVAHPGPFLALGDSYLDDPRNATNHTQAELAVRTAQEDLSIAFTIGEREGAAETITPADLPTLTHFAFNSSAIQPAVAPLLAVAATYLSHHRETRVDVVGHTDPTGAAAYNEGLGMRRAEAVAGQLMSAGAEGTQVTTSSAGETQLLTTDPKQYKLDRRAVLSWRTEPDPSQTSTPNPGAEALQKAVGPPYRRVEDLVPRPVEESGMSGNVPLEEWRWGTMPPNLVSRLDSWVHGRVTPKDVTDLLSAPELDDQTVLGVTVKPRDALTSIVGGLLADPTGFLGRAFGEKP